MDRREPLKPDTELLVRNHEGGKMRFFIGRVIGEGGSCLVYEGYYVNNSGTKSTIRIKECYPHKLQLFREETGDLVAEEQDREAF